MTAGRKEAVVGIVFFATLVVLGAFTIVIGNYNPLKPPKSMWVFFDDVAGLREGNVVRIAGLEVGQVKKMALRPRGVMAMLVVQRTVRLHPNYRVRVRAFSPLGGKYVDIERGDLSQPPIEVPEVEPLTPDGALKGATEAEFISELADLAEKVKPLVISAVANVRDVTEKINTQQGTLGKLVGDPEMYLNLRNASRNLEETTAAVNRVLAKIDKGDGTIGKLVNDGRLYDVTVSTLERVESIAGKVDRGQGTVGALFNDDRMRDDVKATVKHIESILAAIDEGKGTLGQAVRNDRLYVALSQALEDLSRVTSQIAQAKGPLGVLISDERAGEDVKKTLANVERMTDALASGRGTIGRLLMDDRLVVEAERLVVEIRESVEDVREQAPINAFVQAVFQAF